VRRALKRWGEGGRGSLRRVTHVFSPPPPPLAFSPTGVSRPPWGAAKRQVWEAKAGQERLARELEAAKSRTVHLELALQRAQGGTEHAGAGVPASAAAPMPDDAVAAAAAAAVASASFLDDTADLLGLDPACFAPQPAAPPTREAPPAASILTLGEEEDDDFVPLATATAITGASAPPAALPAPSTAILPLQPTAPAAAPVVPKQAADLLSELRRPSVYQRSTSAAGGGGGAALLTRRPKASSAALAPSAAVSTAANIPATAAPASVEDASAGGGMAKRMTRASARAAAAAGGSEGI
jgi:hypothetical protein